MIIHAFAWEVTSWPYTGHNTGHAGHYTGHFMSGMSGLFWENVRDFPLHSLVSFFNGRHCQFPFMEQHANGWP